MTARRHQLARLLPLVTVALFDWIAVFHAWAPWHERIVLCAITTCALVAVGAATWAWCDLTARSLQKWSKDRGWILGLAALPPVSLIASGLGETRTAQRVLGGEAPLALGAVLLVAWFILVSFASAGGRRRSWTMACAGFSLISANALAPARLYLPLRLLCVLGGAGCLALAIQQNDRPKVSPLNKLAAGVLSGVVAVVLLHTSSSNVRFVAYEQLPSTGLLLSFLISESGQVSAVSRAGGASSGAELRGELDDAHLVVVTVDALRADHLGCYGARHPTPNVDHFASRAMRFERAYAQAPHTAFSVTSLLTAMSPDHLGDRPKTLAEVARDRRWFTQAWYPDGLFFDGRVPLAHYAESRFGFAWTDTRTMDARGVTDAVLDRVERLRREGEPRAFLWAHYFDPHEPYEQQPGITRGESSHDRYEGEIAFVDQQLGRLFTGLRRLQRPVVIVLTADHGEEFSEHGGFYHGSSLYEEQIHVPLIISAPGYAPQVIPTVVDLIDVMPTLAPLLGLRLSGVDGRDVGADLQAQLDSTGRDAHAQVQTRRMLVRGRYKLIHDIRRDIDELYDLELDPSEQRNVFDALPEIAVPLHAALDDWFGLPPRESLVAVLADRGRPTAQRVSAAIELGRRADAQAREHLASALGDADSAVRAEIALALGELRDPRSIAELIALLGEPARAPRAAILLGQLDQEIAIPALLDAVEDDQLDVVLRRRAARCLGKIGDEPVARRLMAKVADIRLRSELYLALGRISARHAPTSIVDFLLRHLGEEEYDDAKVHILWALGYAATAPAQRALLAELGNGSAAVAAESLLRGGAIVAGLVGGTDLGPGHEDPSHGVLSCERRSDETPRQYVGSTTCSLGSEVTLRLKTSSASPHELLVRGRSLTGGSVRVRPVIDGRPLPEIALGASFSEARLALPYPFASRGRACSA